MIQIRLPTVRMGGEFLLLSSLLKAWFIRKLFSESKSSHSFVLFGFSTLFPSSSPSIDTFTYNFLICSNLELLTNTNRSHHLSISGMSFHRFINHPPGCSQLSNYKLKSWTSLRELSPTSSRRTKILLPCFDLKAIVSLTFGITPFSSAQNLLLQPFDRFSSLSFVFCFSKDKEKSRSQESPSQFAYADLFIPCHTVLSI